MRHNGRVATTRFHLTVEPGQAGIRLDALLAEWLPSALGRDLSRSAIRRLVMAGAVVLDGRPVRRPGLALQPGRRLEARVDLARLSGSALVSRPPEHPITGPPSIEVLYREPWLLAVAKPAGLLVHASADSRRADLFTLLGRMLAERSGEGSGEVPYLGLHHRLDVETSGVMLFTLDRAANATLSRDLAEHRVEKVYHALVARPAAAPPDSWVDRGLLATVGTGRRARVSVVSSGGMSAETSFAVRGRFRSALLVEARPASGRKHQIRAHLSARGLPVLGDVRYGGVRRIAGLPVARVMLHACALRLRHPVTNGPLEVRCPYPEDFERLLTALGNDLDTPPTPRLTRPARADRLPAQ